MRLGPTPPPPNHACWPDKSKVLGDSQFGSPVFLPSWKHSGQLTFKLRQKRHLQIPFWLLLEPTRNSHALPGTRATSVQRIHAPILRHVGNVAHPRTRRFIALTLSKPRRTDNTRWKSQCRFFLHWPYHFQISFKPSFSGLGSI